MPPDDPFPPTLRPHGLKVALLHPQIAPNTGNIARTCVAGGCALHLVRPLGFVLSDKNLRRSAMDYWPRLNLTMHDEAREFFASLAADASPFWLFSTSGGSSLWDVQFTAEDWLVFGSETAGLPRPILSEHPHRVVRIPQIAGERCLNLAAAVSIAVYEALRQTQSVTIRDP